MKLTDAQFGALSTLAQFGPKELVEVHGPRGMNGIPKITIQGIMSAPMLAKLTAHGLVSVSRKPVPAPKNAVGKRGNARFSLTVSITDAGRAALASA